MRPRTLLDDAFRVAVKAADPRAIVAQHLPSPPRGRTLVVGAGKGAASMALAMENAWPEDSPLEGLVITRYRHGLATRRIRVVEAGHPVPDEAGERAAREILDLARSLDENDLLVVLVSGGGSSLLTVAAEGLSLGDIRATTSSLLDSGAPIQSINVVRKHLSGIQGGRLAAASRSQVLALIVSDVTGDDPTHIASGPCAPDPSTYADAIAVLRRYGVQAPRRIAEHLEKGAAGLIPETPKPGDPVFRKTENRVIGSAQNSLQAAAAFVRAQGIHAVVLGDAVAGEARDVASTHAALVRQVLLRGEPWATPVALISGGECTVTVRNGTASRGRGGRCSEFLLAFGIALEDLGCDLRNVHALAADTDGIDGSEDNAGAFLDAWTFAKARQHGFDPQRALDRNDAYSVFESAGDLLLTGPTRTNVNDFRLMLVGQPATEN